MLLLGTRFFKLPETPPLPIKPWQSSHSIPSIKNAYGEEGSWKPNMVAAFLTMGNLMANLGKFQHVKRRLL